MMRKGLLFSRRGIFDKKACVKINLCGLRTACTWKERNGRVFEILECQDAGWNWFFFFFLARKICVCGVPKVVELCLFSNIFFVFSDIFVFSLLEEKIIMFYIFINMASFQISMIEIHIELKNCVGDKTCRLSVQVSMYV